MWSLPTFLSQECREVKWNHRKLTYLILKGKGLFFPCTMYDWSCSFLGMNKIKKWMDEKAYYRQCRKDIRKIWWALRLNNFQDRQPGGTNNLNIVNGNTSLTAEHSHCKRVLSLCKIYSSHWECSKNQIWKMMGSFLRILILKLVLMSHIR